MSEKCFKDTKNKMEIAKEAIGIIIDGDMEIGFEYIDSRRDKIALW